jgi:hypothetical protein
MSKAAFILYFLVTLAMAFVAGGALLAVMP